MPVVTAAEAAAIERSVAAFEARTGVEITAAVEHRSDLYPEVPWRAFALGASLGSLAVLASDLLHRGWIAGTPLAATAAVLGAGALLALVSVALPGVGRRFVPARRMRQEVRQRAEVVFLQRELFATPGRDAILLLVSRFEHQVVVVPDTAYLGRISTDEWRTAVERMRPPLARGQLVEAFDAGFAAVESLLAAKGIPPGRPLGLLSDTLVQGSERREHEE